MASSLAARSTAYILGMGCLLWSCTSDGPTTTCVVASLAFTAAPTSVTAGVILPPVQVEARDASANLLACFAGQVTVALAANPGGAVLSGTTSASAVGGKATFSSLRLNRSGSGFTLSATATGVPPATTAPFEIIAAPGVRLAFTGQPGVTIAGTPIAPAVAVAAQDSLGNTATTFAGDVTVSLVSNSGGATLTGTIVVAAGAGLASFSNLRITKSGSSYALVATSAGLAPDTSAVFQVSAAPAVRVVFVGQPSTTISGTAINPAVRVTALDSLDNTATSFTGVVTLALATNPAGATLTGVTSTAAAAGVATFSALMIDQVDTGYTLSAEAAALVPDTSVAFDVIPLPPIRLIFTVEPSNATVGVPITPTVVVTAEDSLGATVTAFTSAVTVAIGTNPGGGTLSGTTTVAAVAGVASFGDLQIDQPGADYTLVASAAGLSTSPSAPFTVTPAAGALPPIGHVVIVVEENTDYAQVDSAMPYLQTLIAQGGLATQYYANTHPSIGNYFMLTMGQIITNNDGYSQTIPDDNIVRQLLAAGKTWKDYAEDLPSVGYTGPSVGRYARKHNPLSFFSDVVDDSIQLRRLVPFTQFATDLAGDSLPNYAFVVPNLCNDAHDCSLQTADTWLQTNIAPLLTNPTFQQDGLLVIVFDEADTDDTHGGGRIAWVAVGPKVKPGYVSTTLYQHESTLRLVAQALGLTQFPGAAAAAGNMAEFFNP